MSGPADVPARSSDSAGAGGGARARPLVRGVRAATCAHLARREVPPRRGAVRRRDGRPRLDPGPHQGLPGSARRIGEADGSVKTVLRWGEEGCPEPLERLN